MVNVERYLDSGLQAAVRRSIEQADHLTDGDEGVVAAALQLADLIERQQSELVDSGGDAKTLNTSFQTLQRYLTELGLTPQGRSNLGLHGEDDDDDW